MGKFGEAENFFISEIWRLRDDVRLCEAQRSQVDVIEAQGACPMVRRAERSGAWRTIYWPNAIGFIPKCALPVQINPIAFISAVAESLKFNEIHVHSKAQPIKNPNHQEDF